jgi:hypothetical protein
MVDRPMRHAARWCSLSASSLWDAHHAKIFGPGGRVTAAVDGSHKYCRGAVDQI